jgi:hypothetical protein
VRVKVGEVFPAADVRGFVGDADHRHGEPAAGAGGGVVLGGFDDAAVSAVTSGRRWRRPRGTGCRGGRRGVRIDVGCTPAAGLIQAGTLLDPRQLAICCAVPNTSRAAVPGEADRFEPSAMVMSSESPVLLAESRSRPSGSVELTLVSHE